MHPYQWVAIIYYHTQIITRAYSNIKSKSLNNPNLKSPVPIFIESTLRDVFVYKAGAVTYFFLT